MKEFICYEALSKYFFYPLIKQKVLFLVYIIYFVNEIYIKNHHKKKHIV